MVFATYAMVCFLMPYMDFGIPRNLRGNMFYFLLTIGLLSFSVVIAIYHRAYKELQIIVFQKFYQGLAQQLGEELQFQKKAPGFDAHLESDLWGMAYSHFDASNLIHGTLDGSAFSFAQVAVQQRVMDSLRTDKLLFQGVVLTFELTNGAHLDGVIIGKSHPSYFKFSEKGKALISGEPGALVPRYLFFSNDNQMPGPFFIKNLMELDDDLRSHRVIRQGQDLILVIRNGLLTVAIPVYDRLWELVNWKTFESPEFLSRQILPFTGTLKLANSVSENA